MEEARYKFLERMTHEALPGGGFRIYYDEQEGTESAKHIDEQTGEETTDTYTVYSYRAVDVSALERTEIIVALIRDTYSADDELAIQRQKDDKPGDYNAYNAYAEKCKAIAKSILEGETLDTVKALKEADLGIFDASDEVNSFSVGGKSMWLSPDRRGNLKNACESMQGAGRETVPFEGVILPVDTALQMLSAIENYAAECSIVTATHRAAIEAKRSINTVRSYDFTTGYPEKLVF